MASRSQTRQSEAERHREAAELAIEQLDWCINYLHRIYRPGIAKALQRNRMTIVRRYRL